MDFWQKARSFAEDAAKKSQELTKEAAKRSQEFTKEAAKRSQDFTIGSSKLSEIVSEASKRSKEIAAEASKKADLIKVEALKRADQIKAQIPSTSVAISQLVVDSSSSSSSATVSGGGVSAEDLEKFGITDELREFVKEITINTFRDFPLEDDSEMSDIPTISNVRQDLTKWQETHAKLVLSTVKEISKLRYELCPRVMRERKFWRIYFLLVNNHVTPYEKRYKEEEENKKVVEKVNEDATVGSAAETVSKTEASEANQKTKSTNTKTTDQDLDVFLLGDLGDSDEGPDDGNDDGLDDDDFDKL
ncbi:putative BSD domain-containing protein [Helianthus annuus]|nr:putative BSD domain-containing protein [Helianthus annuus]